MFASKTAILLSLFALLSSVLATPPACLLAAVNQQPNPANLTAVCGGSNGHKVQQAITNLCGSNVAVAESAFAATCSSAGVTVGMLSRFKPRLCWKARVTNANLASFIHSIRFVHAHKLS
jgi:hypothetical protein